MMKWMSYALTLVLAVGCTKKNDSIPDEAPTDSVTYKLKTKIDVAALGDDRKELAEKINAGEPVSFDALTQIFIQDQANEYKRIAGVEYTKDEMQDEMNSLVKASVGKSFINVKSAYESKLEKSFGRELVYQRDAVTLFNILNEATLQCFSGTSLHLSVVREMMKGSTYRKQNHVVINKSGHILPGQMISTSAGYRLVGVETTAAGDAVNDYGFAAYLSGEQRIVDAELFVIAKVFESGLKGQVKSDFVNEALNFTAKKYGFTVSEIKNDFAGSSNATARISDFNTSLFAFGEADMPDKEIKREKLGETVAGFAGKLQKEEQARQQEKINAAKSAAAEKRLQKLGKKSGGAAVIGYSTPSYYNEPYLIDLIQLFGPNAQVQDDNNSIELVDAFIANVGGENFAQALLKKAIKHPESSVSVQSQDESIACWFVVYQASITESNPVIIDIIYNVFSKDSGETVAEFICNKPNRNFDYSKEFYEEIQKKRIELEQLRPLIEKVFLEPLRSSYDIKQIRYLN